MEETKKCPYCGEEIKAIAKKCRHCGEWLDKQEETKDCPICGEAIPVSSSVCPKCSELIGSSEAKREVPTNNRLVVKPINIYGAIILYLIATALLACWLNWEHWFWDFQIIVVALAGLILLPFSCSNLDKSVKSNTIPGIGCAIAGVVLSFITPVDFLSVILFVAAIKFALQDILFGGKSISIYTLAIGFAGVTAWVTTTLLDPISYFVGSLLSVIL